MAKGDIHKKIAGHVSYKGKNVTCHNKTGFKGLYYRNEHFKYVRSDNCITHLKEIDQIMFECVDNLDLFCVKEAVKRGADVTAKNKLGKNMLEYHISTRASLHEYDGNMDFENKLLEFVIKTVKDKNKLNKFINNNSILNDLFESFPFGGGQREGDFTSSEKKFLKTLIKNGYDLTKGRNKCDAVFYAVHLIFPQFKWVVNNLFTQKQLYLHNNLKGGLRDLYMCTYEWGGDLEDAKKKQDYIENFLTNKKNLKNKLKQDKDKKIKKMKPLYLTNLPLDVRKNIGGYMAFGKKRKVLTQTLKNQAKKHNVRLTIKRNGKRVYKTEKMLKQQIKNKKR